MKGTFWFTVAGIFVSLTIVIVCKCLFFLNSEKYKEFTENRNEFLQKEYNEILPKYRKKKQ